MRNGFLATIGGFGAVIALAWLAASPIAGQSAAGQSATSQKKWAPPHTSWGDPDIQGQWNSQTSTPLERPRQGELANKENLTDEEAAKLEAENRQTFDEAPRAGDTGTYNSFWRDEGKALTRTSLVVDPPDGRIPALTPEAAAARRAGRGRGSIGDEGPAGPGGRGGESPRPSSYEDFSPWTRCISRGWNGIGSWYSSNYQVFQSPGYVVIFQELIHEPRIIPLDGRPHLAQDVSQWLGDSRGHWEGNTLVVDTKNFDPRVNSFGSHETLHLIERYTLTDANTLDYKFTVDDPKTFTKQWTVWRPMRRQTDKVSIFEYACHEGNYAMTSMLTAARNKDKAEAAAKKESSR
jgi:hypothetical protein